MAVGDAPSWSRIGVAGNCLLVASLVLGGVAARADEIATIDSLPLAAAYGGGVHAYFAGDYARSHDDLSSAIQGGIDDPRAWYFRGLAALQLGRIDEAEADFTEAAERESRAVGMWSVSRSLERVQGPERLQLERHRIRARVAALQRDREMVKRRYSGIEERQPDLLRRVRPVERLPAAKENPFADRPAAEPTPAGLKLGALVSHAKFGAGVITDFEGDGPHARVQVNFEEAGSKWLVVSYANLQVG
jgi:tetratricopeptide (TPR) repeat protein